MNLLLTKGALLTRGEMGCVSAELGWCVKTKDVATEFRPEASILVGTSDNCW